MFSHKPTENLSVGKSKIQTIHKFTTDKYVW